MKSKFGWRPTWNAEVAIEKSVEWYKAYSEGKDMIEITNRQIGELQNV